MDLVTLTDHDSIEGALRMLLGAIVGGSAFTLFPG
jgi:hypothetical protein